MASKRYQFKLLIAVVLVMIIGTVRAQWNPVHTIGSLTNTYRYNYNQVPDKLVELYPPVAGGSVTGLSYQWEQSAKPLDGFVAITGATGAEYTFSAALSQTTFYRRKTTNASSQSIYSNAVKIEIVSVNWEDLNYIRVHSILKPGVSDWVTVDNLAIGTEQKLQSTTYYDGLGRPVEKLSKGTATPTSGGAWGDMVLFSVYDQFGRQTKGYLPYTTLTEAGKYKTTATTEQASYYTNMFNEASAYSEVTMYDNSPLNRPRTVKSPGTAWAAGAGNKMQDEVNFKNEGVYMWAFSSGGLFGTPYTTGIYEGGSLYKSISIDEKGKSTIEYINKSGQLLLKKVQLDESPSLQHDGWICTYYVYDYFGRLRYTIEPEAVKLLDHVLNWSFVDGADVLKDLCFSYAYDEKGRMIAKRSPGAKELLMIYDKRDRLVFTQDGNQRNKYPSTANQEWTATLYDELDRPTITTLYKTSKSVTDLQTDINNAVTNTSVTTTNAGQAITDLVVDTRYPSITRYAASNSIEFVSTSTTSFESGTGDAFIAEIDPAAVEPTVTVVNTVYNNPIDATDLNDPNINTILKYQFYDNYGFVAAQGFDNGFTLGYATNGTTITATSKTVRTISFATGSRTRVLNTNTFITATTYYDEDGQPIQSIEQNIKNGTDISTYQYHFDGRVLSNYNKHTAVGTGYSGFGTLTKHLFDGIGRVTETWKTYGSNNPIKVASFMHDDMGRVKSKQLSPDYASSTGLEKLDYSYNIRGQLTGINKDYALKKIGYSKWDHYFGMYLGYDNRDNVFDAANLTGQITGTVWTTQGDDAQRKYDYTYDNAGRLSKAIFNQKEKPTDSWDNSKLDFSVLGSGTGKIEYDLNGNLLNMVHKGVVIGNNTPVKIDDLQYVYYTNTNQLQKVTDVGNAGAANGKQGDFKDGSNVNEDYDYDYNGNQTKDLNRGIAANNIKYNFLDKPEEVLIDNKGTVKYVYDADGTKLQKIYTPDGSNQSKITTYINQFTYEETKTIASTTKAVIGGGGNLQSINFEEGRIRIIQPTAQNNGLEALLIDGTLNLVNGSKGVFDYFVKDNLGNTRMVLTDEVHQSMGTCTMEDADANRKTNEEAVFGQQGGGNEVAATRFAVADIPGGWSNSNIGQKVSKLSKLGHTIGPNSLLRVMAGDELTATTQYFYKNAVTNGTGNNLVSNVITSLIGAISGSNASTGMLHGGQAANVGTQLNSTAPFVDITSPDANNTTGDKPKAYLTVLFFDERFNYVPEASDFRRVVNENDVNASLTLADIKAPKNGYAYIYVSNESDEPVYFDNLKILHNRGRIAEENHYYAYGLRIAGISSRKLPDVFEGNLINKSLYQGEFSDFEEELDWNDFELRSYDPQIGRWLQQDPYSEFSSPYVGMGIDPVNNVDPNGGLAIFGLVNNGLDKVLSKVFVGMIGGGIAGAFGTQSSEGVIGGMLLGGVAGAGNWSGVLNFLTNETVNAFDNKNNNIQVTTDNGGKKTATDTVQKPVPDTQQEYKPVPKNGLPAYPEAGKGAYNKKSKRWRWYLPNGDILEWDKQHGELEWYDKTGKNHKGVLDPNKRLPEPIKPAIPQRQTPKFEVPQLKPLPPQTVPVNPSPSIWKTIWKGIKTFWPTSPVPARAPSGWPTNQIEKIKIPVPTCGC